MRLLWRFPRVTAWLATVIIIGAASVGVVVGVQHATTAPTGRRHMQGVVVMTQGNDEFALAEPGRPGREWFHIAPGAHISMAHLLRHLHERAGTDVTYTVTPSGALLAWSAD